MLRNLAGNWWMVLARGVLAILFGGFAFALPLPTILALALLWGAYAAADGLAALLLAIRGPGGDKRERRWLLWIGVFGVLAGIAAFAWPRITVLVLLVFVAVWAIAIGVMQIVGALRLRREVTGEWLLGLSGVVAVLFGALILFRPDAGAVVIAWTTGYFALIFGVLHVALAFKLRKLQARP